MGPLNVFLLMCPILSFDVFISFISCEEMLALPFKLITEIPGNDVTKLQHLIPNNLVVNTDNFTEEKKTELCQNGLDRANSESGNNFKFEEGKPGKSKVYVLIAAETFKKSNLDNAPLVEQLYPCPTNPSTYISAQLDEKTFKPIFGVFYKQALPPPEKELTDYQMKLVEGIFEATVNNLFVEPRMNIEYSEYDVDSLSEEERCQICRKASQIVQGTANVSYLEKEAIGSSRFFVVTTQTDRHKNTPKEMRILLRAFDCPTQPKIYVHVNDGRGVPIVWTMMRKNEIKDLPDFYIMGFKTLFVKSIQVYERLSFIHDSKEELNDSIVDMDLLLGKKLNDLCQQAVRIVLGKDVEFTNETVASQYYVLEMENESTDKPRPVRAIQCPVKPMIHIHITNRESMERMVAVIIQRDQFETFVSNGTEGETVG